MTYKQFLETREAILEDWRLWSLGYTPSEITKELKIMWEEYKKLKQGN